MQCVILILSVSYRPIGVLNGHRVFLMTCCHITGVSCGCNLNVELGTTGSGCDGPPLCPRWPLYRFRVDTTPATLSWPSARLWRSVDKYTQRGAHNSSSNIGGHVACRGTLHLVAILTAAWVVADAFWFRGHEQSSRTLLYDRFYRQGVAIVRPFG